MKKFFWILVFALFIVIGLLFYTHFFSFRGFRVVFLNVGQGDAALVEFENGGRMLVDCGPDRKILQKLGEYLPFFDRRIDYLLVTHPDLDHYGGCSDVLKRYEIKNIVINGEEKNYDNYWLTWKKYLDEERANVLLVNHAQAWQIASNTLEFLSPDPSLNIESKDQEGNNFSIVFKLKFQEKTFLFTGDTEEDMENLLVEKYCATSTPCKALASTYLKLGHHGSDTSSGEKFLNAVSPDTAIASVGKNKFGHPSRRIIRRLERMGTDIWRTDEKGDMIIQ